MAELGLAPMCTSFGVQTVELLPAWEKRRAEVGTLHDVAALRPLLVNTVIADTDAEAIAEAQIYMTRYMQAQIDHYGAFHVDMRREGLRGLGRDVRALEGADGPEASSRGRRVS